jgi:hypothetical protein
MMRSSAQELEEVVKEINNEFHTTGSDLITILLELEKYQQDLEKTRKMVESLRRCKDLSNSMVMATEQITSGDHYSAMHTIQILQNELLDISITPMANKLKNWLPKVTPLLALFPTRQRLQNRFPPITVTINLYSKLVSDLNCNLNLNFFPRLSIAYWLLPNKRRKHS